MSKDKIIMPRELTAENGAKAVLIGEFYETIELDCPDCDSGEFQDLPTDQCGTCDNSGIIVQKVGVEWTTIKAIYKMAVENLGEESKDSQRLDWLISNRARILDAPDSEFCTVYWFDSDGEYETCKYADARDAIDAAMKGQHSQIG